MPSSSSSTVESTHTLAHVGAWASLAYQHSDTAVSYPPTASNDIILHRHPDIGSAAVTNGAVVLSDYRLNTNRTPLDGDAWSPQILCLSGTHAPINAPINAPIARLVSSHSAAAMYIPSTRIDCWLSDSSTLLVSGE
jgi:hypothetical protein